MFPDVILVGKFPFAFSRNVNATAQYCMSWFSSVDGCLGHKSRDGCCFNDKLPAFRQSNYRSNEFPSHFDLPDEYESPSSKELDPILFRSFDEMLHELTQQLSQTVHTSSQSSHRAAPRQLRTTPCQTHSRLKTGAHECSLRLLNG